jgi:DNA/RNA-binding domain of Phe-tRNA-synthetase-like protein
MLDIAISDDFSRAGVAVRLGCIQARVAVAEGGTGLGQALKLEAELRVESLEQHAIPEIPAIAAARRAFKALGKDPSRYRVSSEALIRRIDQGKVLYRINTVVDTNNLVSLHTGMSAGSYRIDALAPPLVFRKAVAGESYQAIGRGPFNLENLPVLADAQGPFGSPASDSERSKITLNAPADATEVLMVIYGFGEAKGLARAIDFAADCLTSYCKAEDIESAVVAEEKKGDSPLF